MNSFLTDLLSNITLLAVVVAACRLINRFAPGLTLSGAHVFVGLVLFALVLDTTLTFLVFADAQSRYGQFSTPAAFAGRAAAYATAAGIVLAWQFVVRRRRGPRAPRTRKHDAVVIRTSPYSESQLPM
jgi:hypothetical protein